MSVTRSAWLRRLCYAMVSAAGLVAVAGILRPHLPVTAYQIRSTEVTGQVLGADGPLSGARVRIKGKADCTTTDSAGRFQLPLPKDHVGRITVSQDGYYIGGATIGEAPLRIRLTALPAGDNQAYRWIDPRPAADGEENCANCPYRAHLRGVAGEWTCQVGDEPPVHQSPGRYRLVRPQEPWLESDGGFPCRCGRLHLVPRSHCRIRSPGLSRPAVGERGSVSRCALRLLPQSVWHRHSFSGAYPRQGWAQIATTLSAAALSRIDGRRRYGGMRPACPCIAKAAFAPPAMKGSCSEFMCTARIQNGCRVPLQGKESSVSPAT